MIAAVIAGLIGLSCLCLVFLPIAISVPLMARMQAAAATSAARAGATATARSEWPIILVDDFSERGHGWRIGRTSGQRGESFWWLDSGVYRSTITSTADVIWYAFPRIQNVNDFRVVADTRQIGGPATSSAGIVFRLQSDQTYYVFRLRDSGVYNVAIVRSGFWANLIDWTTAESFKSGQTNRLEVVGEGSHFTFYVNQEVVGEIFDDHLREGKIGVATAVDEARQTTTWEFDNFEVRVPGLDTLPPLPTSTSRPPTATPVSNWPRVLYDQFAAPKFRWPYGSLETDSYRLLRSYYGGYFWRLTASQEVILAALPEMAAVRDFDATLVARLTDGQENSMQGMTFRAIDDKTYYLLGINSSQEYAVILVRDGAATYLHDWTATPPISSEYASVLRVHAVGSHFEIYVNYAPVTEFEDSTLTEGRVGVAVGAGDSDKATVVQFSSIEVRAPVTSP